MTDRAFRVVVADDDLLVRRGVVAVLAELPHIEIVAECADLPQLLAAVAELQPDVVVTDIRMPPTRTNEGIEAAGRIRRDHPGTGVVLLSQHAEPAYVLAALEGGSDGIGYLLKENVGNLDEFGRAVRSVADGGSAIDGAVVSVLVAASTARGSILDQLTSREREVLSLIAHGLNNAAVGQRLTISDGAVAKHINSIFSKLGLTEEDEVHRRVKAVLLWLAEH